MLLGRGNLKMYKTLVAAIIVLVFVLVIIGIIYYAYVRIVRKARTYSRMLFGTDSLLQGIKQADAEAAVTPKSVSSATSLYLPRIMKDFPEFHFDEMKARAENVLVSYLRSVDGQNAALLTEGTNELKEKLRMRIQMLQNTDQKEHFQNIRVHKTELYQYRKTKGRCSVVFQSALECLHYTEKAGQLLKGRKDRLEQAKYNVEVIYIQDRDTVENLGEDGLGLNCPNCGAPLPGVGAKKCAYCDTPVIEFNIRTWNFSSVAQGN